MRSRDLTQAQLKAYLRYDAETGKFVWLKKKARANPGDIAGCPDRHGYGMIGLFGRQHKAHRLAWLYMTGESPSQQIDHINGDKGDNRWANLREATPSANGQNITAPKRNNKTGYLGVTQRNGKGRVRAVIFVDGRHVYLGDYDSPQLAHAAYMEAKREMHAGFCTPEART